MGKGVWDLITGDDVCSTEVMKRKKLQDVNQEVLQGITLDFELHFGDVKYTHKEGLETQRSMGHH